ncbi:MAG: HEAT repeat domain-containing protein [Candidatus Competibacteraceae bacterium]|nr:HEAT repeat domain-containing protein [Candidatus Competibacteraceae bacterium]
MIAMNQKTLVDDLKRQIACGQVVVVTGTGVSVAVCEDQQVDGFSVATWTGLLKHGVHFCQHTESTLNAKEAKAVLGQIRVGETDFLVAAAELVTERLRGKRPGAFRGWLKDSVGKLAPTQPDIIKTLASWPVKLTTLNYDHLLEAVTSRPSLTWQDRDKIEEILRYGGDAVIHLHGDFDRPESVILGLSSYAKVVNDSHTQAVLQLFTLGRTLLFVGCGGTFQDPNFSRLIEWGREALKDSTARHFVLCRKSEKAKFVELQKTAPWLYPIVFGAKHEDLLPFLRGLAPAAMPSHPHGPPPKPPSLHLAVYAKAVRDRYAKLKLESLDATGCYYRELELWRVFVPQHVRECQDYLPQVLELPKEHLRRLREEGQIESGELDAERIQELRRRYLDQTPRNALELVDDPVLPKVVILGDPGAGKSCLLQALTLRWAERPELERQRLDLPLLIELRAYAQARERDHINGFLDFWQRSPLALCQLDSQGLRELLESGRVQVFFDGLDEVFDPALREEVANVIQRFANDFPCVRIVVTSRVIGHKGESFRSADFHHFMLQELDDDQITTFLGRWYRDTYCSTEIVERDEKHARLTRAITDSQPIRELAGNPLLLTMMAILNRYCNLPRDRAELYEECSKLLLQQWKVEDALRADPDLATDALAIGLREKQGILRRLARAMQTGVNGPLGNLIATDQLETIIEDAVKPLVKGNPRAVARALIRHLRERNFILCFAGGDSYAFVHRTFLEYFCADDLRARFEHEKSIDADYLKTQVFGLHWPDETWHEVLCLVAGMIHPKVLAGILEFLIDQVDTAEIGKNVFLAVRCIGEIQEYQVSELGQIERIIFSKAKECFWRDRSYSSTINFKPPSVQSKTSDKLELITRIWRNHSAILSWLRDIIRDHQDTSARVFSILKIADWKDDLNNLFLLRYCIQFDQSWDIRWAAVEALIRGWKDDLSTLPLLKALAQSDESSHVRQSALEALVQHWKGDPDVLPMLKIRARTDKDKTVQRTAIEALARDWKDDPDLLPLLKNRAQSDGNDWIRWVAVEALAQDWKDDRETLSLLKVCIQNDESWLVRRVAVWWLARNWEDDPDVLPLLKERAETDDHVSVRRVALLALRRLERRP